MPKASVLQSSFNAGEVSPLMYGRTDSPRYKQGLSTSLNYIPTLQGPNVRRPATKFMNTVADSSSPPCLIPFEFSLSQNYMLEFGENYIRFYTNNGQIVASGTRYAVSGTLGPQVSATNLLNLPLLSFFAVRTSAFPGQYETIDSSSTISMGSILQLESPYSYLDVPLLRFYQQGDLLYLLHPNYPPYKLQRYGNDLWEIQQVYFQDGPYLPLNSYENIGDQVNVTLTLNSDSSPNTFVTSGPSVAISGAITDPASSGQIQITTSSAHGYSSGQQVFINNVTGTTEANNQDIITAVSSAHPWYWAITVTSTTTFLLNGSTFVNAYISGGAVQPALFWQDSVGAGPDLGRSIAFIVGGSRYWGTIGWNYHNGSPLYRTFYNSSCASVNIGPYQSAVLPTSTTVTGWYLGVYSAGLGYPSCGAFHQNRFCLTGAANSPQELDGSVVGQYENFAPSAATGSSSLSVSDANALQFTLNSTSISALQWLSSNAQGLLSGSGSSEWAMTPSSQSEALTPTNFNAVQTSFYGSANAEVIQAGNAAIYIQRAQRKVREMNFFFQVGTFRSTDLTEISEHITLPSITKIVLQKETQPLVWGLRSDGQLVSMIYDRSDVALQAGWTRHQLGGQSDSAGTPPVVYSMAVIPSGDLTFDQLWLVVQRYINGATVYTIEYMTKIFDDSILQEDAFQGDCGATYYAPKTITGITTATTAVVTSAAHGFSNGNQVRIVGVDGLNQTTYDVNGNPTISNLVNETTFVVAGVTTNTFQLNTFAGAPVSSVGYGAYVSGGSVSKLVTTISGLTWLEGETVGVLADGGLHPNCVVTSGGNITLDYPAAKVQIGYTFNSQGQLLRAEAGAADGTSIGKTRRTTRAAFMLHRIGDLSIGTSFTNLIPFEFTSQDNQEADEATPLWSGIKREGVESAYDFESQLCFQQNSMLPGSIQAITSFMEEFDV